MWIADAPVGWLRVAQRSASVCREVLAVIENGRQSVADGIELIRLEVNSDRLLIAMYQSGYIQRHTPPPAIAGH